MSLILEKPEFRRFVAAVAAGIMVYLGSQASFLNSAEKDRGNPWESRKSDARQELLRSGGGDKKTERAVAAAFDWLARHQNPDGSWSLQHKYCCTGATCTGGVTGWERGHGGSTALGLLPLLAAGHTHRNPNPYHRPIYDAIQWLLRNQKPDGDLSAGGPQMYCHAMATMALCEAYGMSKEPRAGQAAQSAIKFIESGQNLQGGWRYSHGCADGDTSVFGWQMMALKSGMMAGLTVDRAKMEAGRKWLALASADRENSPEGPGRFGYMPPHNVPTPSMTAVGLLVSQHLGAKRDDPALVHGVKYLLKNLPTKQSMNSYYWYYATQVLHNMGGREWETWNNALRPILVEGQCMTGCALGSWDPAGDLWHQQGGRLMTTSLAALMLEICNS